MLTEAQQQQYPYLYTYLRLYSMFSNNCMRKNCKKRCICKLKSLLIADTLFDSKFQPYPYWL